MTTVGILYCGEMGAAVAAALVARGNVRVVSTAQSRGERTARRGRESGCEMLDSLADVVRASDVVFSLVSPDAAVEVASEYAAFAGVHAPANAIYVDANSIGPELAESIATKIDRAGRAFVDAAINGLAKNLTTSGTLFLSGPRAADVASIFEGAASRVTVLGPEIGKASAMKMLLGGMSKGLCALFAELSVLARRREMLPDMLDACERIYPGMMLVINRMLPTYAQHAERRATEMRELQETAESSGVDPGIIDAIRAAHDALAANVSWGDPKSVAEVIELLLTNEFQLKPREEYAVKKER